MKTFKINYRLSSTVYLLALTLTTLLGGCKKFLEPGPPNTQLVTASVFNNNSAATSALTYIYTDMNASNGESYKIASSMCIYADELQNYSTDITQVSLYTNSLQTTLGDFPFDEWVNDYKYIYMANAVINGLQTTSGCSSAVKQQLTGEALFIRAYWHFYLTNIYGDVPLVLTTSYTTNASLGRSPRKQVLQQVIADLQQAKTLLNGNYVNGSDTVVTTERVRPNKSAALALLARAYLYLGDYDNLNATDYVKADSAASAVIGNSNYSLSPLNQVFLENSTEAIWQLETPSIASADSPDGQYFILQAAPNNSGYNNSTALSSQLLSAFELGDQRFSNWVGSISESGTTYYFPYKYKQNTYKNSEFVMVLRLGEQYLIRAEARAREGNITGAQADLNTIRTRAGLANTTANTQADLLTAILHERQVELFTEWGHRWFDLERAFSSGVPVNAATVLGAPGNVCHDKGGTWNPSNYQLLFPVPQAQRLENKNLSQNPGY